MLANLCIGSGHGSNEIRAMVMEEGAHELVLAAMGYFERKSAAKGSVIVQIGVAFLQNLTAGDGGHRPRQLLVSNHYLNFLPAFAEIMTSPQYEENQVVQGHGIGLLGNLCIGWDVDEGPEGKLPGAESRRQEIMAVDGAAMIANCLRTYRMVPPIQMACFRAISSFCEGRGFSADRRREHCFKLRLHVQVMEALKVILAKKQKDIDTELLEGGRLALGSIMFDSKSKTTARAQAIRGAMVDYELSMNTRCCLCFGQTLKREYLPFAADKRYVTTSDADESQAFDENELTAASYLHAERDTYNKGKKSSAPQKPLTTDDPSDGEDDDDNAAAKKRNSDLQHEVPPRRASQLGKRIKKMRESTLRTSSSSSSSSSSSAAAARTRRKEKPVVMQDNERSMEAAYERFQRATDTGEPEGIDVKQTSHDGGGERRRASRNRSPSFSSIFTTKRTTDNGDEDRRQVGRISPPRATGSSAYLDKEAGASSQHDDVERQLLRNAEEDDAVVITTDGLPLNDIEAILAVHAAEPLGSTGRVYQGVRSFVRLLVRMCNMGGLLTSIYFISFTALQQEKESAEVRPAGCLPPCAGRRGIEIAAGMTRAEKIMAVSGVDEARGVNQGATRKKKQGMAKVRCLSMLLLTRMTTRRVMKRAALQAQITTFMTRGHLMPCFEASEAGVYPNWDSGFQSRCSERWASSSFHVHKPSSPYTMLPPQKRI